MKELTFTRRAATTAFAAAFALSVVGAPAAAFADDIDESDYIPSTAQATGSVTTGAACRAAMPALDILGIDSVEEQGQFVNTTDWYDWTKPKYWFIASDFNTELSPYLFNLANGLGNCAPNVTTAGTAVVTTPTGTTYNKAAFNSARNGGGAGPDAALAAYGSDSTDDAVWNLLPDIIVGDGAGVDYSTRQPAVSGYAPAGVNYDATNYSTLIQTMHDIADEATTGRYGDPADIADAYEEYINGTMGYIEQVLNGDITVYDDDEQAISVSKKKVALVTGATQQADGSWLFTLNSDVSGTTLTTDGTASQNRYLEATAVNATFDIATNYGATKSSNVTAADLRSNVDLIMVGGQSGSSYEQIMLALWDSSDSSLDLLAKTYYVVDNGTQGAMYGVVMNSVENAQNVGRILGCLYPELIDQQAFVAYYFEQFYHIDPAVDANDTSNTLLGYVMDSSLDGVRNWTLTPGAKSTPASSSDDDRIAAMRADTAALVQWSGNSASGYSQSDVQDIIDAGL